MMLINEIYSHKKVHPFVKPNVFMCGVEHEVENLDRQSGINSYKKSPLWDGLKFEEDGSLNNGTEVITPPGCVVDQVDFHSRLHKDADWTGERFSERTSTHVHVNMHDFTIEQTISLVKMYSFLEPYFFAFVGKERESNIHCVPLWATHMMRKLGNQSLEISVEQWHKYTALNIKPLSTLKTIEFRHLFGTTDTNVFASWLTLLEALHNWAREDNGKFLVHYKQLLKEGYLPTKGYILSSTGKLGKLIKPLEKYVNEERCYDVYLSSLLDEYPGITNLSNFLKT